jgi:hypothetical protein
MIIANGKVFQTTTNISDAKAVSGFPKKIIGVVVKSQLINLVLIIPYGWYNNVHIRAATALENNQGIINNPRNNPLNDRLGHFALKRSAKNNPIGIWIKALVKANIAVFLTEVKNKLSLKSLI